MRRLLSLAIAVHVFVAAAAFTEKLWIDKSQLAPDPADPSAVGFSVEIREPGSYQAHLMVQGESERRIELALTLRPEAGGPARIVHFSFTGRGCG